MFDCGLRFYSTHLLGMVFGFDCVILAFQINASFACLDNMCNFGYFQTWFWGGNLDLFAMVPCLRLILKYPFLKAGLRFW